MNIDRLHEIIRETTTQLRKGAVVEERSAGAVDVTEVFMMPHVDDAPDDVEKVDVEFMVVGVDKAKAQAHRAELVALLRAWPQQGRLQQGPSYIEVGAEIGDQGAALCLFALGKVLGLWDVITPGGMGITGPEARMLAGSGMVMTTGLREAA